MVLRSILLIFLVSLLTACPRSSVTPSPVPVSTIQQNRPVSTFTAVHVEGTLNVSLHTGFRTPQVTLRGDPRDLTHVITQMVDGALYVTLRKPYPRYGSIQVDIKTNALNSFEYHGKGMITGNQLRSQMLDVLLDNQGQTTLQGQLSLRKLVVSNSGYAAINGVYSPGLMIKLSGKSKIKLAGIVELTQLDMSGDSWLSLYWIRTKNVTIRACDKSFIQLAGIVDKLDVELRGSAHFNGRYLRARRAFVKTRDKSIAEMSAVQHQHTLATDASDIHFYNLPTMKADFMAYQGAVLDMRDLSLPTIQEFTRYNK